jgi:Uma2 family endonuclease
MIGEWSENPMPTVITEDVHLEIPEWVTNLAAFRQWAEGDDFPDKGNIWWLNGKIYADMSKEQIFTHLDVKGEYYHVLKSLAKREKLGRVWPDGLLLTNAIAGFSGKPDFTFVSFGAIEDKRVVLVGGRSSGYSEIEGSPDMLLEVISDGSEFRDREILLETYYQAGVLEYWLVDARKDLLSFDIYRRGNKEFVPVRKQGSWLKSAVFGKSFRLTRTIDKTGHPEYTLEVK